MPELRIAVLPGDGIGPEVTAVAVELLRRAGEESARRFRFESAPVGAAGLTAVGDALPAATLALCLASDAVLLGAVGDPVCDALPPEQRPEAGLLRLRAALGGYANLRPARVSDALVEATPFRAEVVRGVDLLIVRELLGGLYFGRPRGRSGDTATDTLTYSAAEIERVARRAFELARTRRRRLTSVDKANVLESSRLWREVVSGLAPQYPEVRLEHCYVDAFAMALNLEPRAFDVIVTENTFGDILSDQAASFCGSLGMLPSGTLGGCVPLFEPIHGSAPALAGRDRANPIGAARSAAMLLRYAAGLEDLADGLETAIENALDAGCRTADLVKPGIPSLGTAACGAVLLTHFDAVLAQRHAWHAV